jgi:hypothetical protein
MSEIKFACPHCSQHIACDDTYCGEQIDCPGCEGEMFVPQRATFIPALPGGLTLSLPVAHKETRVLRPITLDVWTEERWRAHAAEHGVHQPLSLLPVWLLLLLPFVAALILVAHHANFSLIRACFTVCALLSGFYWARIKKHSGVQFVLMGLLYSFAMLCAYMALAVGLLFGGCLIMVL